MIWEILGIAPTTDQKAITSAYRNRLLQVNPEEKPEEFKALRAAYEQAMQEAKAAVQSEAYEETPLGQWKKALAELYQDYPRRIDPECWRAFLDNEICRSLDSRPQAEEALLQFFLERYFLPQAVWQVLDQQFSFSERVEELYDRYPRDFVDHVILSGIFAEPSMPFDLFRPGLDGEACDELRRLYYQAGGWEGEERADNLKKLTTMPERHPYCDALVYLEMIHAGRTEEGKAGLKEITDAFPTDPVMNIAYLNQCPGEWALAEEVADRVLAVHPQNAHLRTIKAECMAQRGEYDDAKEIIFALIHDCGGDQVQTNQLQNRLRRWNETIIREKEPLLAANPGDSSAARTLAWCYLQNEDLENAIRVSAFVDAGKETAFDYHNLLGKLAFAREQGEQALTHFQQIISLLEEAADNPEHPDHKQAGRLPDFLQITGTCLMNLGREQEALALYDRALTLSPDDPTVLDHMGRLLYLRKDYTACTEIYRKLTRISPRNYHGFLMAAICLYELGRDREAFDAVNQAMDLERSDLTVYVTKMRILLRNGVWDEVRQMLEFVSNSGVGDEITVCWCRALLAEFADKDEAAALAGYQDIAKRMEHGEILPWEADVYYRIAILSGKKRNMKKPEDRAAMMAMLEQCLVHDPEHEEALDYKAWLLRRDGKSSEALEIYRRLEARSNHSLNVELGLAQVYYDDLEGYADQSLKYYLRLLQHRQAPEYHFYAGTCLRYLGDLEGAAEHFRLEQELDPGDVDGYNGLAYVFEAQGRYPEALEEMDKAIGCVKGNEGKYAWLFKHKAQILRRMGKAQDAIDLLSTAVNIHGAAGCFKTRFDTCCQFGRWAQAKTALSHWVQVTGNNEDNAEASVMLQLYQGKMMKATMAFAGAVKHLDSDTQDELKMTVADLEGNPERGLRVWSRRYPGDPENTRTLGCLAHAQWLCGHHDEARQTAEKLLALLDKKLAGFTVDEALYRTQRVRPLAILGRMDEARSELALARTRPLCSFCAYGSCKDADVFEAELAEIAGDRTLALKLMREGKEKWPDELDFAAGIARLTKKGKK